MDFEFFSTLKRDNILQIYCPIYLQYPILYGFVNMLLRTTLRYTYILSHSHILQLYYLDAQHLVSGNMLYTRVCKANILSNIFAISDTLYCPLYLQYKVSYIANILDVDFEFFSTLKRDNILQIYCPIYLQYPILYIVRYICNIKYLILQIYWMWTLNFFQP